MVVYCDKCGACYDDETCSTICWHYPLGTSPETYCRKHDLYKICGNCRACVADALKYVRDSDRHATDCDLEK